MWWLLVLLSLLPGLASGATLYADSTLGADCTAGNYNVAGRNCTGSAGNAYNTMGEAYTASAAGDTIVVRGTFTPGFLQLFKANQTWRNHPGEMPSMSGGAYAVLQAAAAGITIRGLEIHHCVEHCLVMNHNDGIAEQNLVHHCNTSGIEYRHCIATSGDFENAGDRVIVRENYIHTNGSSQYRVAGIAPGGQNDDNIIEHNYITNIPHGIWSDVGGGANTPHTVRYNWVKDTKDVCLHLEATSAFNAYYNLCQNPNTGGSNHAWNERTSCCPNVNTTYNHNTLYNPAANGWFSVALNDDQPSASAGNWTLTNNIFWHASPYPVWVVDAKFSGTPGSFVYKNNLFWITDANNRAICWNKPLESNALDCPVGGGTVLYTGAQLGTFGSATGHTGNLSGNPGFVNAGAGNFNLQASSPALNAGLDGLSLGAFQPPQIASKAIATATPNVVRVTWNTPFPLEICTAASFTVTVAGSNRTPTTSCTLVSATVTDIAFPGAAVTAGQAVVIDASQGAVKSKYFGCNILSLCQDLSPPRHENFPYTDASVTNNVSGGCAPTVTSCVAPDSATDDHVLLTINTCSSSPVLPASGITGFTITGSVSGNKACSTFTRVGATDQIDCDTTAITAGETLTWSYGSGVSAAPTTAEFDNCNRSENPLAAASGWSGAIDTDFPSTFLANGASCLKGGADGAQGSSYRSTAISGDSEISVIFSDAEAADGTTFEIWPAVYEAGTATPDGYLCALTSGATDTLGIYRLDNGVYALLTSVNSEMDNNMGLGCRRQGTTLSMQKFDGANWSELLSFTDANYTGTSRALAIGGNTTQLSVTGITGGAVVTGGSGNVTNNAGTPMGVGSGSCTNNVANPPAAPVLTLLEVTDSNAQQIRATFDAIGGTMTLNGGGCAGFSCKENGNAFALSSCAVTTSPVIALNTTNAMLASNAYTCSYAPASGNVTNGTTELAAFTDAPVTNSLTPITLVRGQYGWRIHEANEPVTLVNGSAHWKGPLSTGIAVMPGGVFVAVIGMRVTGAASPSEALAVRCQDNGGAEYAPDTTFAGHLIQYAGAVPSMTVYTNLQVLANRPLPTPGGGSAYDGNGRVYLQRGPYPSSAREPDTDTVVAAVFQVSPTAPDGSTISCYLQTDTGIEFGNANYTPAKGTPMVTVQTKMARGM